MMARVVFYAILALAAVIAVFAEIDRAARFNPALARFVPSALSGFSAQRLAEQHIAANNADAALKQARLLLAHRPLPAEHLTLYAQAQALEGNAVGALTAIEAAAGRGWREPFAQNATAAAALAAGEYDIAAQRLSAMWAIGFERDRLGTLTRTMLETPAGRSAFARRLAAEGTWQSNFLSGAGTLVGAPELADTLVRARDAGARLECGKLEAIARQLEGEGKPALAARVRVGCP